MENLDKSINRELRRIKYLKDGAVEVYRMEELEEDTVDNRGGDYHIVIDKDHGLMILWHKADVEDYMDPIDWDIEGKMHRMGITNF